MKFYYESVGECVSQVYGIEAKTWEKAKQKAFKDMKEGDHIAECQSTAILKDGDYCSIDRYQCSNYATLCKGTWTIAKDGLEYWEDKTWYFDDDEETFYNSKGEEFNNWQ